MVDASTAQRKEKQLSDLLQEMGSVLVSFSGGVDSSYLLKIAHDALGSRAVAATGLSQTYAREEMDEEIAKIMDCPIGTVRSMAAGVRLRASPRPVICLASAKATSMLHRAAYRSMIVSAGLCRSVVSRATMAALPWTSEPSTTTPGPAPTRSRTELAMRRRSSAPASGTRSATSQPPASLDWRPASSAADSRPAATDDYYTDHSLRLTWQAARKHKIVAAVTAIHRGDVAGLRTLLTEHPALATVRIGAIHCVVFAGFGANVRTRSTEDPDEEGIVLSRSTVRR